MFQTAKEMLWHPLEVFIIGFTLGAGLLVGIDAYFAPDKVLFGVITVSVIVALALVMALAARPDDETSAGCLHCQDRGTVPNVRLQIFENCPQCAPAEDVPMAKISPRSRASALADRRQTA